MNEKPDNPEFNNLSLNARLIKFGKFVVEQLKTADLNPNEGKLRSSAMPTESMNIPNYPPIHDDTMPNL